MHLLMGALGGAVGGWLGANTRNGSLIGRWLCYLLALVIAAIDIGFAVYYGGGAYKGTIYESEPYSASDWFISGLFLLLALWITAKGAAPLAPPNRKYEEWRAARDDEWRAARDAEWRAAHTTRRTGVWR